MSALGTVLSTCSSPANIVAAISKVVQQDEMLYHSGSFTPSIYDTAWLSIACKKDNNQISWLFPASFEYILQSQREDGTWQSYASSVDGILNTLASLLALLVHRSTGQVDSKRSIELSRCIEKAHNGVRSLLQGWSVEETVHVGFEVLVPSLLRQVEQHGFQFDFSGRQWLFDLYSKKTKSFKPEMAYSKQPTTLLHSLEAFIGLIDFDQVSHHCSETVGIFGSPAATTAYLLNRSTWDSRAETYLRTTVAEYGNCGRVPSAFPTGLFEITWALSTLFSGAVNLENFNPDDIESLSSYYKRILKDQAGVIGFARGVLEDADDTARALLTLHYLGNETDPTPMIEKFKSSSCFRTYQSERNPSFSVNCNVLLALLCSESIEKHSMLVQHTVEFLLAEWATKKTSDKWNLSPYYSSMLLADVLISMLKKLNDGFLLQLPANLLEHKIPITLCQILSKTLSSQHKDGSWRQSVEETAYSLITIARCLSLPWDADLRLHIIKAFNQAQLFISTAQMDDQRVDYLWVEKVTYSSSLLGKVYCLTALNIPIKQLEWNSKVEKSFLISESYQKHMRLLFSDLPLFAGSPSDCMGLAFVEAFCFAECLKEVRCIVFPRDELPMTKDKYLSYIPVIWTTCNQIGGNVLPSGSLWEMILLSMLNYQIDEYMETVVHSLSTSDLRLLILQIRESCGLGDYHDPSHSLQLNSASFGGAPDPSALPRSANGSQKRHYQEHGSKSSASTVITKYIDHILQHAAVLCAHSWVQKELAMELHNFLIAHITQNIDSSKLKALKKVDKTSDGVSSPGFSLSSYFEWVHSTAADNTSCPFSFRFFACLVSSPGKSLFEGPQARYLSQSLARHLATMCRQYNDYGSAMRDTDEGNLNSLDFPEFREPSLGHPESAAHTQTNGQSEHGEDRDGNGSVEYATQAMKDQLMGLAEFERGCMELAFAKLDRVICSPAAMKALRVFVNVTDSFGQIYVRKDIASRVQGR